MSAAGVVRVLVCVLSGCGAVSVQPDASEQPPIDAEIDAPPLPPEPVRITVLTTLGDGLPDTAAKVVFQDPGGVVVLDTAVDPTGKAEAMMPDGGSVTVVRVITDTPTQLTGSVTTFIGVKPGDDLTAGRKALATITNQGGQTQMTISAFPLTGDATGYSFTHTCGSSFAAAPPATLTFRDSCHGATFDLIGVATGGTVDPPRFVRVTGINYVSGGSFSIPVGFQVMGNFTVTTTNTPLDLTNLSVNRFSMIGNQASAGQGKAGVVGTATVVTTVPYVTGTRSQVQVFMTKTGASNSIRHDLHTAGAGTSVEIDLSQNELPFLMPGVQTVTGSTWTIITPGDAPDGQSVTWNGNWVEGTRNTSLSWRVIEPASMTGSQLPRLPAAYARFDPQAQTVAVTPSFISLVMTDYDVVASYDEFRQQAETLVESSFDDKGAFIGVAHQRRYTSMNVFPN